MEKTQLKALRCILGLPPNTKRETLRILTGCPPIGARLDFLKMNYFLKLISLDDDHLAAHLLQRTLKSKKMYGYLAEVISIANTYNIPHPISNPPLSLQASDLKRIIFMTAFKRDIDNLRDSKQATLLRNLFPPESYHKSYPHEIFTRLLMNTARADRIPFLQL